MLAGRWDNPRGITFIEQMVSLLLGSVLLASLYGYFCSNLYQHLTVEVKTGTLEDARGALDIIIRDLRHAGSWGTGRAPNEIGSGSDDPDTDADSVCNRVYAASPSLIHIQMDLDGNENEPAKYGQVCGNGKPACSAVCVHQAPRF